MIPGAGALRRARSAAAKRNLEASLQIEDWNQTCADQEFYCVYCGKLVLEDGSIEHFLPMSAGGGTTITNCLLACQTCNKAKGDSHPEEYLLNNPEKLVRIWAYLAQRKPGQGYQPFWGLPVQTQAKEQQMTQKEETRITSYTLASGIELHIRNNRNQIALQFRQPPISANELLAATDFQLGTILTLPECVALTQTLLAAIALKLEEPLTRTSV